MRNLSSDIQNEETSHVNPNPPKTIQESSFSMDMIEWTKCKLSLRYFAENYVYIPVTGANLKYGETVQYNCTTRYKILFDLLQQHDAIQFLSSRQQGKTTVMAIYIMWCMIFFPKLQISFLTIDKNRALDFISRCKEIMDFLPKWLQLPQKGTAEKLTYYELVNGSKVSASYVAGSINPDSVGRGLSTPLIIMDEVAFIPHAEVVWAAVQPSLSAAKIHAKKNGYPYGVRFTTTPNGGGDNFFYKMFSNSTQFDDIFDHENDTLYEGYEDEFEKEGKNNFLTLQLHWSETRSQEWYEEQKKELNFNTRKINQELDLVFLGSDNSIFSDEVIGSFVPKKFSRKIDLLFNSFFYMFVDELPLDGFYILGVDTASSTGINSDYSAMVLMDAHTGLELGYFKHRFGILKHYSAIVKQVMNHLVDNHRLDVDNFQVVIERNNVGKAIIEDLVYAADEEMSYSQFLFQEKAPGQHKDVLDPEMVYGLWTSNSRTNVASNMQAGKRDKMFTYLQRTVNESPNCLQSNELQAEARNLVQKSNGRIEAGKGQHDDLIMAYNFCLYSREILIKSGVITLDGEDRSTFRVDPSKLIDYMSMGLMNTIPAIQNNIIQNEEGNDVVIMRGLRGLENLNSDNNNPNSIIAQEKELNDYKLKIANEMGYSKKEFLNLSATGTDDFHSHIII